MRWGHFGIVSALLIALAAGSCNKEDCETGLSVGVGLASSCAAVGGILCAVTLGVGCAISVGCGVAAGIADASKEACRACGHDRKGDNWKGVGAIAESLSNEMKKITLSVDKLMEQSIKLEGQIQLTQIIALYGQDITNYQKVRGAFKRLRKNSKGLIIRNLDSASFEKAANDVIVGLAASSMQIFKMMTGGHPLKKESIFKAVPLSCQNKTKEYFLKVMLDCYLLESVSRAMKGESMNPTRVMNFKKQLILVENHFMKDCGCQNGLVQTARKSNLQSALASLSHSQPSGQCSTKVVYAEGPVPSFIMDDSTDRTTLKKINLLYSVTSFSPAKSAAAKAIAEKYSIEELKLAHHLSTSNSLADLRLFEGHHFCAKTDIPKIQNGQCVQDNPSRVFTVYAGEFSSNTPQSCIKRCQNMKKNAPHTLPGFAFAGVQIGSQCFCGQCAPRKELFLPSSKCNKRCTGDSGSYCGGFWAMNVFATGIQALC